MAYSDYEAAGKLNPVDLYLFSIGSQHIGYTSALQNITHTHPEYGDITYVAIPITRTEFKQDGSLEDGNGITVKLPKATGIGGLFSRYPPSYEVEIEIRRGNEPDESTPPAWLLGENFILSFFGKVVDGSSDGVTTELSVKPMGNSLSRPGNRRNYMRDCPYLVFSAVCGADPVPVMVVADVAGMSGASVTLDPGWMVPGFEAEDYIGGEVTWLDTYGVARRTIIRVVGDTLRLSGPTPLVPLAQVTIVPGCPRTLAKCNSLYQNGPNYGGQPFIPKINPVNKNTHD